MEYHHQKSCFRNGSQDYRFIPPICSHKYQLRSVKQRVLTEGQSKVQDMLNQNTTIKKIYDNDQYIGTYNGEYSKVGGITYRHGRGVMKYECGYVYDGQWRNDKMNGYGILTFTLKEKESHAYSATKTPPSRDKIPDNLPSEIPVVADHNNIRDFGKDRNPGRPDFFPLRYLYNDEKAIMCKGYFKNNNLDGRCTIEYVNNNIYEGYTNDNKKNGIGIYKWTDGRQYIGNWKNNTIEGQGVLKFVDGKLISGIWKNNNVTDGTIMYPNGDNYKGNISSHYPSEKGNMKYANGDMYIGQWRVGNHHGKGHLIKNGIIHEGEWNNNGKIGFFTIRKKQETVFQYWNLNGVLEGKITISVNESVKIEDFNDITLVNEDKFSYDEQHELTCHIGLWKMIPIVTPCGHQFCQINLQKNIDINKTMACPLCRQPIDDWETDHETMKLWKKCKFQIGDKKKDIDKDILVKCYQFINKHNWKETQKSTKTINYSDIFEGFGNVGTLYTDNHRVRHRSLYNNLGTQHVEIIHLNETVSTQRGEDAMNSVD